MNKEINFLVRVQCATYNHVHYITDALDGFCMQQTTFPFICIIVDDASTDGEQEIIKKYMLEHFDLHNTSVAYDKDTHYGHVTFAQHKINKNCFFAALFLKENHYSHNVNRKNYYLTENKDTKYVAICEGDDYWTDPSKLQKQVTFLEVHEEYAMCFHAAKIKHEEGTEKFKTGAKFELTGSKEYTSTQLCEQWIVPTASIVYRKTMVDGFKMKHPEWLIWSDMALVLKCSHTGKVFGMSDFMSVYRIQPNSVTNNARYRGREFYYRLPNYFRCLYYNFPQVRALVKWSISQAYYSRMKRQANVFCRIKDYFLFVFWDTRFAKYKMAGKVKRIRENFRICVEDRILRKE